MKKKLIILIILLLTIVVVIFVGIFITQKYAMKVGSLKLNINNVEMEKDMSMYLNMEGNFDAANWQRDLSMTSDDVNNINKNLKDYKSANVPFSIKNNYALKIYDVDFIQIKDMPKGIWYDNSSMNLFGTFDMKKGDCFTQNNYLRFIYNTKEIKKEYIEKIVKEGKIGVKFKFKHSSYITVPINEKTAKFAF